jgi:hypothetical protein
MFVIDEVHNFFGSRQWQETGQDVLFYLSQHRKLGDTVICVTQAVGNVDKQFRSVTQDFTYLRNLSKEKYGRFRLPSLFVRRTYSSPPGDGAKAGDAMESGTFTLDVSGLAACYNTAAGVGIHAKVGDTAERKTGVHWTVGVGLVILVVCLLGFYVPKAVASLFKTPQVQVHKQPTNAVPSVVGTGTRGGRVAVTNLAKLSPELSRDTNYCKGFMYIPAPVNDFRVCMADGRVLSMKKGEVSQVNENFVVVGGRPYPVRK